ncbi:MAG: glycosyltransferase [Deltaproteobacteria bacterium]|nr:glycosyltransferase [Deltaproteobacteria bacterium]
MKEFYFTSFENREPPDPVSHSPARELLWQFLASMNLVFGAWYIVWRWHSSLNYDALWFALPLVIAETCAYFGLALFTINLWKVEDYPEQPPPQLITECIPHPEQTPPRPLAVDIFFPTYNEDPELVRLSIQDAKAVRYPYPIDLKIYVLDDGKRETMKSVAEEEGVHYLTRPNNIGFKAGNMRNALEQTSGDFLVICDADTRPFPTILEHTLGYFRDSDVAWVQTPQWFFDLPEGSSLPLTLKRSLGLPGQWLGWLIEKCIGPVRVGADPFGNDPRMFYDVILRRRNWANASFCCGAGSIHRREAVMEAALKSYSVAIDEQLADLYRKAKIEAIPDTTIKADLTVAMRDVLVQDTEVTPYKFHVSEDIYTSIVLHSDRERRWKSVLHPRIESKMLSPQDLYSWMVQRFKYAGGTFDIAIHDNPLFRRGMTFPQKVMYATTFWSYLGCLWNVIFFLSPIVYLFTDIAPVAAYNMDFYLHIFPFLLCTSFAFMVGTWGVSNWEGQASYLYSFPLQLRALWTVLKGERIKFPVTPKDRQEGNFFSLVLPQFFVIVLTILGLCVGSAKLYYGYPILLSALLANCFWGVNNIVSLSKVVRAAFWSPEPTA